MQAGEQAALTGGAAQGAGCDVHVVPSGEDRGLGDAPPRCRQRAQRCGRAGAGAGVAAVLRVYPDVVHARQGADLVGLPGRQRHAGRRRGAPRRRRPRGGQQVACPVSAHDTGPEDEDGIAYQVEESRGSGESSRHGCHRNDLSC